MASDAEDPGSALVITAPTLPAWLSLVDAGDGTATLSGTPAQKDVGNHDVTVRVKDTGDRVDQENFVIAVSDGNDAPDASGDTIQMVLGGTVAQLGPGEPDLDATSVLWNDTDADGDVIFVTSVTTLPANGTVTDSAGTPGTIGADGTFIYTHNGSPPDANNELDRFRYRISDGNGGSDSANVIIMFSGGNSPPAALDDAYSVPNGGSIPGTPNVLANDSDPNGDNLTKELDSGPANDASFMLNADGTFTYVHNGSATTTDSFTYRARDDSPAMGVSRIATVALTITPPLDTTPPVITRLGSATVNLVTGAAYSDAGATALDQPGNVDLTGSIVVNNPVNTAVNGTYVVTYDVSDAAGNAAPQVTRTVIVAAAPPPPPPPPPPPSSGGSGAAALLELLGLMFLFVMSCRRTRLIRRSI
jgi:hypothetical protein